MPLGKDCFGLFFMFIMGKREREKRREEKRERERRTKNNIDDIISTKVSLLLFSFVFIQTNFLVLTRNISSTISQLFPYH